MAYINVPTSTNLEIGGMAALTLVAATCNKSDAGAAVFTLETDGAYRIAMTGIGTAFATGDWIIVRDSVSTGDATKNNDGIYEIEDGDTHADWIEVVAPVDPMVWEVYADAAAADFDEIDTFILHPSVKSGKFLAFIINSAATSPEISFEPNGFASAVLADGLPKVQGTPALATSNIFQIETAPFMQTESEVLTGAINRAESILMRVIPANGVSGATVKVGFIQVQ